MEKALKADPVLHVVDRLSAFACEVPHATTPNVNITTSPFKNGTGSGAQAYESSAQEENLSTRLTMQAITLGYGYSLGFPSL